MNIPMRECIHGHGPFPRGSRCRPCDLERRRRSNQASRDRAKAGTHCRRGHPYRDGSWQWLANAKGEGRIRVCLLCINTGSGPIASFASSDLAGTIEEPPKPMHSKKIRGRRILLRDRLNAIHLEILAQLDNLELMSKVELAEWRSKRAEMVREADLLQSQLDTGNCPSHHRKRSRPCRAVAQ